MSTDTTPDRTRSRETADRRVLDATVVRYRNEPDRCTVAPPEVSSERQLTAWLSVDAAALVALAEIR